MLYNGEINEDVEGTNKSSIENKSGAPLHSSSGYTTIDVILANYFVKSIILCDLRITLSRLTPFDN